MNRSTTSTILTLYWIGTLVWTVFVLVVLLKPSPQLSNHDYSLETFLNTFFSFNFKFYDYFEAAGHVLLFIVLTAFWTITLSKHGTQSQSLRLAVVIALAVALSTEIGQFFVNRGSLWFDLLANFLGILLTSIWIVSKNNPKVICHD